jgi:hypothetical protein
MSFEPKNYTTLPSELEVAGKLDLYREVNGSRIRKPGMTCDPQSRFQKPHRYHMLTQYHHFGYTNNWKIAREIEKMLIELLKKLHEYHEHQDLTGGRIPEGENIFTIYLAIPKDDGDKCVYCDSAWLTEITDRLEHVNFKHVHEIADLKIMREAFVKHKKLELIQIIDEKLGWHEGVESVEPPKKKKKKN